MKKRVKIETRRIFSYQEKELVLSKSKGVCSHCGLPLAIWENFSIDHAIPISNGGTNDIRNLVPLCKECNKNKMAIIYDIDVYYRHLTKGSLKELRKYYDEYIHSMSCISATNMCSVDVINCKAFLPIQMYRYGSMKSSKDFIKTSFILEKAIYMDLDSIKGVMDELGVENSKELISLFFDSGSIYLRKSKDGGVSYFLLCKMVKVRKLVSGVPMVIPMLFMRVYVSPKYIGGSVQVRLTLLYEIEEACSKVSDSFARSVYENCGSYGMPILTSMYSGCFSIFEDNENEGISKRGYVRGSISNVVEEDFSFRMHIVYGKSVDGIKEKVDSYLEFAKDELRLATGGYTNKSGFICRDWVYAQEAYKLLNIYNIVPFLSKYSTDCSLGSLLRLCVPEEEQESVNYWLEYYSILPSRDVEVKTSVEDVVMDISEIVIPSILSCKDTSLPSFIKAGFKSGAERPLVLSNGNRLKDLNYNYALYTYYKNKGRKRVPCRVENTMYGTLRLGVEL